MSTQEAKPTGENGGPAQPAQNESEPTSLLRPLVEDLHARRAQIELGGGEQKIAKQHAAEK
ncbi:MAG: hypothetical protein QOG40_1320, partial [Solirubrobacteraceae bacterium]|nr:hypothetical protein [Solirubrobacteraceae bacterium]